MNEPIDVPTWGLNEAERRDWPPELRPRPVDGPDSSDATRRWPTAPVLVHVRALDDFDSAAEARIGADGRLPDAVLYLPVGAAEPDDSEASYDAVVDIGDWPALISLFGQPEQLHADEYADDLPLSFLLGLDRPIGQIAAELLPLPAAIQQKLWAGGALRAAFDRAAHQRLLQERQRHCLPSRAIADHVRSRRNPEVERHVADCRVCAAELQLFERRLVPARAALEDRAAVEAAVVAVRPTPLYARGWDPPTALQRSLDRFFPLAASSGLLPTTVGAMRMQGAASDAPAPAATIEGALAWLGAGQPLMLLDQAGGTTLYLYWEQPDSSLLAQLYVDDDPNHVEAFWLELPGSGFRQTTRSGELIFGVDEFLRALEAGAEGVRFGRL